MFKFVIAAVLCASLSGCGAVALGILAGQQMNRDKSEKTVYVYPDGQRVEVKKE